MKNAKLFWVLVLVTLWGGVALFIFPCSATESELPFAKELQAALDGAREEADVMGVSVAIVVPGYKPWVGVSGMSDPTAGERIRPDMLFDIASIEKNFQATLVLKLVEEGTLFLDDPLHKYLPDYPNIESSITIRQLLNLTSGIDTIVPDPHSPWRKGFDNIDFTKTWTPEEILATFVDEADFPPGSNWAYSTTNYVLVKMIVEKVTGSRQSVEIKNRLLKPLNLNHTLLDFEEAHLSSFNIAHAWRRFRTSEGEVIREDISSKPITWIATLSPQLIYSSAEDLARWMHALYHEGRVLSQASLDEILTFHSPCSGEPFMAGYGLGVVEISPEVLGGQQIWGHLGSQYGYRTFGGYFPQHGVSMALLINDDTDEGGFHIMMNLLGALLPGLTGSS